MEYGKWESGDSGEVKIWGSEKFTYIYIQIEFPKRGSIFNPPPSKLNLSRLFSDSFYFTVMIIDALPVRFVDAETVAFE